MQIFQSYDSYCFKFNGIKYVKNFLIIKQGNTNVSVHNAFDVKFQLLGSTHFSEISVNGSTYSNQSDLMSALSTLLFSKQIVDIDGLTGLTDTFTSSGTYSNGTLILNNNLGDSLSISGFSTGTTSSNLQTTLNNGSVASIQSLSDPNDYFDVRLPENDGVSNFFGMISCLDNDNQNSLILDKYSIGIQKNIYGPNTDLSLTNRIGWSNNSVISGEYNNIISSTLYSISGSNSGDYGVYMPIPYKTDNPIEVTSVAILFPYMTGSTVETIATQEFVSNNYLPLSAETSNISLITQTILSGNTGTTASESALFNALALKANTSNVVLLTDNQTIAGTKTFSSDGFFNSVRIGRGGGNNANNVVVGNNSFSTANGSTTNTTVIGANAMPFLGAGAPYSNNTAIGASTLGNNGQGASNTAVGASALFRVQFTSNNIGVGVNAGTNTNAASSNTGPSNSIYIGNNTTSLATNNTNQIVIGDSAQGNGSNTVTLGNTSIVDTFLRGRVNIQQYTTGTRPTYVKGAIIFDSTLNKLLIGGATTWEVISST